MSDVRDALIDVTRRVLDLERHPSAQTVQEIREQIHQLRNWQLQMDEQLPAKSRKYLSRMGQWIVTAVLIVGALAVIGVFSWDKMLEKMDKAGEDTVVEVRRKTDALQADVQKRVDDSKVELNASVANILQKKEIVDEKLNGIDDLIRSRLLGDQFLQTTRDTIVNQFASQSERARSDIARVIIMGTLTRVRIALEEHRLDHPGLRFDAEPDLVQELIYVNQSIIEDYVVRFTAATLTDSRRDALLFTVNGIVEESNDNEVAAATWFKRATEVDPTLPEPHILLGRIQMHGVTYIGDSRWRSSNGVDWQTAARGEFETALACQKDGFLSSETRKAKAYIYWLNEKRDAESAINDVTEEIKYEGGPERADPRMLLRRGFFRSMDAIDSHAPRGTRSKQEREKELSDARDDYYAAVYRDPKYLKALNNYLWFATHGIDEKLFSLRGNEDAAKVRVVLAQYKRLVASERLPNLLDTIAQAEASLGDDYAHAYACADYVIHREKALADLNPNNLTARSKDALQGEETNRENLRSFISQQNPTAKDLANSAAKYDIDKELDALLRSN